MPNHFTKPDFHANILNITATLAEFLGCPNDKPTLPLLAAELNKHYKNVVFLIFDGLGSHPIEVNLQEGDFLRRHIRQTLTSTFPSTTTNATTSLLTNKYPMEHGWFGWCLYFEELKSVVNLFPGTNADTGEPIEAGYVRKVLPYKPFYEEARTDYTTSVVVPEYWDKDDKNRYVWHSHDELFAHIQTICGNAGKQFIYAYCDEPDATMHRFGVHSAEAKALIGGLSAKTEAMFQNLSDTLLIVTADHGQVDVEGYLELYKDEELLSLLAAPPYMESRAAAFRVKQDCRQKFETLFRKNYGEDYELYESAALVEENYFGGDGKNAALLGDYIAVGKTNRILLLHERAHRHKGHHASLTAEMFVPLIFIGKP